MNKNDLTTGNIRANLVRFAIPYLIAAFLQTFYGMADLFVVGLYNGTSTTTAVSIGSQVMHMLTVIILGFAMGTTVHVGRNIGGKNYDDAAKTVGNSVILFTGMAIIMTVVLVSLTKPIVWVMNTPVESVPETFTYLLICLTGIPFIIAYNVIASVFRGAGDSKRPLYFAAVACFTNVILDFAFIGGLKLGAAGAALGTISGQAVAVLSSIIFLKKYDLGFKVKREHIKFDFEEIRRILSVGTPIAMQDGIIQVAFIVITIIANSRGLIAAASVGIVEKIICFVFLVPSAFLSAISAVTAQNMGAGKTERARKSLYYGLIITVTWGLVVALYNQFLPGTLVGLFTKDALVLAAGCEYLRSYSTDTIFAAVHFCFSGYFCGDEKSGLSFIHNILSVSLLRIPGTYFFSKWWPDTLYPMGWAAPLGSLFSAIFCVCVFAFFIQKEKAGSKA